MIRFPDEDAVHVDSADTHRNVLPFFDLSEDIALLLVLISLYC
jgi:hypothetical protein